MDFCKEHAIPIYPSICQGGAGVLGTKLAFPSNVVALWFKFLIVFFLISASFAVVADSGACRQSVSQFSTEDDIHSSNAEVQDLKFVQVIYQRLKSHNYGDFPRFFWEQSWSKTALATNPEIKFSPKLYQNGWRLLAIKKFGEGSAELVFLDGVVSFVQKSDKAQALDRLIWGVKARIKTGGYRSLYPWAHRKFTLRNEAAPKTFDMKDPIISQEATMAARLLTLGFKVKNYRQWRDAIDDVEVKTALDTELFYQGSERSRRAQQEEFAHSSIGESMLRYLKQRDEWLKGILPQDDDVEKSQTSRTIGDPLIREIVNYFWAQDVGLWAYFTKPKGDLKNRMIRRGLTIEKYPTWRPLLAENPRALAIMDLVYDYFRQPTFRDIYRWRLSRGFKSQLLKGYLISFPRSRGAIVSQEGVLPSERRDLQIEYGFDNRLRVTNFARPNLKMVKEGFLNDPLISAALVWSFDLTNEERDLLLDYYRRKNQKEEPGTSLAP